jgi:hypothetical protein
MDNPFSWDYLTTEPGHNEIWGAFAVGFLAIYIVGFIISFVSYAGWADRRIKDPVIRRMMRRWSGWWLTLFSAGLFFFLIRVLQINPFEFGKRIWLYLSLLSLAVFGVWCIIDYRRTAPEIRKQIENRNKMNQVLTNSKGGKITGPGAPLAVGGRPVKRKRR